MESAPGTIRSQAASIFNFRDTNAARMRMRASTGFIIRAAKKSQLQSRGIRQCKRRRVREVSATSNGERTASNDLVAKVECLQVRKKECDGGEKGANQPAGGALMQPVIAGDRFQMTNQ